MYSTMVYWKSNQRGLGRIPVGKISFNTDGFLFEGDSGASHMGEMGEMHRVRSQSLGQEGVVNFRFRLSQASTHEHQAGTDGEHCFVRWLHLAVWEGLQQNGCADSAD